MSLTVFMATLRAIAEHQVAGPSAPTRGTAVLRNFACSPVSRWLMGAYGFGEHYTHHVEPAIPYYHLGAATRALAAHDPTMRPGPDYFAVLAAIVRDATLPPSARSAS
jgi:fatty acid desaturase